MPTYTTHDYYFCGQQTITIWSEAEMAAELGISREDLLAGIRAGRFCYHLHPAATGTGEYEFNAYARADNLRRAGRAALINTALS